ncbi:SURF1 family protein [Lichenicoccus sp.]|uniref:SURF1 family protein n=1 Tax=Lichenicoccus sp. TaxID=2781899 RepID=UPI003D0B6833
MRRLLVPFVCTLLLVALTTSLGIWQVHRLAWKQGLLAQIDVAERAPPVPLPRGPTPFQKIVVSGNLDGSRAVAYADDVRDDAQDNAVMGTHLVEPLLRAGQPPMLVDLGWEPYPPKPRAGPTTITGFIRPAERPTWLSATDDPGHRRFYTLDPAAIARALRLPAPAPYTLVALGPAAVPDPQRSLPRPPNDHLQYAITWFSLSLVGIVMFGVWALRALAV